MAETDTFLQKNRDLSSIRKSLERAVDEVKNQTKFRVIEIYQLLENLVEYERARNPKFEPRMEFNFEQLFDSFFALGDWNADDIAEHTAVADEEKVPALLIEVLATNPPELPFEPGVVKGNSPKNTIRVFRAMQSLLLRAFPEYDFSQTEPERDASGASWVPTPLNKNDELYNEIYQAIERLIKELHQSNMLAQVPELDGVRRENLINALKTILKMLEAPMIEASLVKKSKDDVQNLGEAIKEEAVNQVSKDSVAGARWALKQILLKVKDMLPDDWPDLPM